MSDIVIWMGSNNRQKAKHKRKVSNEDIAAYRERDKVNHQKKRHGILNVSQVYDESVEGEII